MTRDLVAVVLAAGIGQRFWPITTPKSFFPLFDRPLIYYTLSRLAKSGIHKAIVVVNDANEDKLAKLKVDGIAIEATVQKGNRGMAQAVLFAAPLVGDNPCLILNAEDIVDPELISTVLKRAERNNVVIAGKKMEQYFPGGYLRLDQNKVVGLDEKPCKGHEPSSYVNLVFHYFPKPWEFFQQLTSSTSDKDDVYEKALSLLLKQRPAEFVPYDGTWVPLKFPWHVLGVMGYFLTSHLTPGRGQNVQIKKNVVIEEPVYLGDNVKIFENSKIIGPTYISEGTIIGNNNMIRESHIGRNCVTGFNSDITRSYIGNDCWFHTNYVGDSVLEGNVSMGSGAVLANLRLDEGDIFSTVKGERVNTHLVKLGAIIGRNVRVGVNASIMPGVKVGRDSMIGAGVVLDRDLPEESFCIAKSGYEVTKNTKTMVDKTRKPFRNKIG